jgi:SAM-dependent methyltransferase
VEEIPPVISDAIRAYIERKTGKPWGDPTVTGRLSRAIVAQKSSYWKKDQKKVSYSKGYQVLGYLAYHFPVYYAQAIYLMYDLARRGLVFPSMRILDAGTGPGTVPLAIATFMEGQKGLTADVFSIEQSEEFVEAYTFLAVQTAPRRTSVCLHRPIKKDIRSLEPDDIPPSLDLIIFQNVLCEIPSPDPAEKGNLVRKFATRLSERGCILLVEPADLDHSQELRRITSSASGKDLFIHAPCRFLWGQACGGERCWSFVTKPPIRPPPFMQDLARGREGYRFQNVDIKYSYSLLRKVPPPRIPGIPLPARRYVRLSTLERHLDRRVRVAATIVSGDLGDSQNHIYYVCDGSSGAPAYAVLPRYHVSEKNRWLLSAPYGDIAEFSSVLVRFNPRYQAYNLLVTRGSTVRSFPAQDG